MMIEATSAQKPKFYLENLDGLRFICFLSVFLFHSFHTNYEYIKQSELYGFVKWELFGNGSLGVNFFFVLSGFLITYLLLIERKFYGNIDVVSFWKRRIFRIWPLFYFCVFFGFIIFPFLKELFGQTPNETASPIFYLFFLNNFDFILKGPPDSSVLGVLWSVAVEEQFYFFWPMLLFLFPQKWYSYLFMLFLGGSIIFRLINIENEMVLTYSTFSCAGDLMVGALGAVLIQNESIMNRIVKLKRFYICLIYLIVFVVFFFRMDVYRNLSPFLRAFERPFIAFIFLMIILEQCFANKSMWKMKNFKTITHLGTVSYGLYCFHFIGILITTTLTGMVGLNEYLWQVIFLETSVALLITIAISKFSYRFYEGPFLKFSRSFARIEK